MGISRKDYLNLVAGVMGGWFVAKLKPDKVENLALILDPYNYVDDQTCWDVTKSTDQQVLEETGYFPNVPWNFMFDESKYSPLKRELPPEQWKATNRHMPIEIDKGVINQPGERSLSALKRVVAYVPFDSPRYVAEPGERVTMCNIAAWDWSRALSVHLPHWMGETELSANMLFRWVSHPKAGGIHGEGWQPVDARVAQLLANRGIPVFALAENPKPGRHGHVALVYPNVPMMRSSDDTVEPVFASVSNGRWRGSNGIKELRRTFRRRAPTYFVHKSDFVVYQEPASGGEDREDIPSKGSYCWA